MKVAGYHIVATAAADSTYKRQRRVDNQRPALVVRAQPESNLAILRQIERRGHRLPHSIDFLVGERPSMPYFTFGSAENQIAIWSDALIACALKRHSDGRSVRAWRHLPIVFEGAAVSIDDQIDSRKYIWIIYLQAIFGRHATSSWKFHANRAAPFRPHPERGVRKPQCVAIGHTKGVKISGNKKENK